MPGILGRLLAGLRLRPLPRRTGVAVHPTQLGQEPGEGVAERRQVRFGVAVVEPPVLAVRQLQQIVRKDGAVDPRGLSDEHGDHQDPAVERGLDLATCPVLLGFEGGAAVGPPHLRPARADHAEESLALLHRPDQFHWETASGLDRVAGEEDSLVAEPTGEFPSDHGRCGLLVACAVVDEDVGHEGSLRERKTG